MEFMLDTMKPGNGQDGGNDRADDTRDAVAGSRWSYTVRLCLAVAAVSAAYLLMTADWPTDLLGKAFTLIQPGTLPGPTGRVFASLR